MAKNDARFTDERSGSGTREWSEISYNIGLGCSHGCLYCYARANALRFKKLHDPDNWTSERMFSKQPRIPRRRGVIMFPTQHDITPYYAGVALSAVEEMLRAGRHVLIVSKPHFSVMELFVNALRGHTAACKEQVLFRFTIGSTDERVLRFWEPGAPPFYERLHSLALVHATGFKTSVSSEPLLGGIHDALNIYSTVARYVTDKVWFGPMNKARARTAWCKEPGLERELDLIAAAQTEDELYGLYHALRGADKVAWKEPIRKIIAKRRASE